MIWKVPPNGKYSGRIRDAKWMPCTSLASEYISFVPGYGFFHPPSLFPLFELLEMGKKLFVLALALAVLALDVHARREGDRQHHDRESSDRRQQRQAFRDLKPRKPREIFRSEGGRIEEYDAGDYRALCDAEFGVKRVTVEPNGLVLPGYKDSHVLLTVMEGRLRAGIVSPFTDKVTEKSVFELKKGDTMAIPRGFAAWLFNDGNQRARFLDVADTTTSCECGRFKVFHLAGSDEQESERSPRRRRESQDESTGNSLLHGFSKEILAQAWGVDESIVQRLREGQKGSQIIKVDEQQRRSLPSVTNSGIYMDFVYRLGDSQPDVYVPRGGELRQLNSMKMPILKELGLSAACYQLKSGALTAPAWAHNAHKVIYVNEGRGRIEVVRENGEQAVEADMDEGSLLVVPANYPSAKLAGNEGLDFAVIYKTHLPIESYLAGRNSVYKGVPRSVMSSALQIDEQLQQKLEDRRAEEAYIFPRRERQPRRGGEEERSYQFVENLVRVFG
ncbi:legumin B [Selaginella moellendorffii]|nr:legumin B [Selaginella moellendorffii]|eukprot:XP_002988282.2 legumin B [Selaginella moellendorffii]